MDTQNTSRQLRYLEEVRIPLHRAGFGTLPLEGEQLPVLWNGTPLCRITGKGSVFYRREDADTPQAEDALYRVEDIAAKTLEYMRLLGVPFTTKDVSRFLPQIYMQHHTSSRELMIMPMKRAF